MVDKSFPRFSQLYLDKGPLTRDSARFRNRLSAYFVDRFHTHYNGLACELFEKETGAKVPRRGVSAAFSNVFLEAELRDVLDAVSIVFQVIKSRNDNFSSRDWVVFVERCMREENLAFRVDSEGTVHFYEDQEFEANRISTLALLDKPEYLSIKNAFESAYRYMDSTPPDTKAAIRSIFESIEVFARTLVPSTKNLNKSLVKNQLKDLCTAISKDEIEKKVMNGMLDGFAEWVDAAHNYRHGQPTESPVTPSRDLTIYMLSTGSAFLRLLLTCAEKGRH